ncbi:hypothetical protein [Streptomyces sp. NPDC127574]|uniref:hypothetical protein n=1 Tax=Streptomyces sp. NPDC127574 TaxID=3345401 RepID=UPI00362589DF
MSSGIGYVRERDDRGAGAGVGRRLAQFDGQRLGQPCVGIVAGPEPGGFVSPGVQVDRAAHGQGHSAVRRLHVDGGSGVLGHQAIHWRVRAMESKSVTSASASGSIGVEKESNRRCSLRGTARWTSRCVTVSLLPSGSPGEGVRR